ncbi:MAG: hypothetical protein WCI63_04060 [bacterium]
MTDRLNLPDMFYVAGLRLFIIELSVMLSVKAIEVERSSEPPEVKQAKHTEFANGLALASKLSDDCNDILDGEKSMDIIDKYIFDRVLDSLADIQRTTNSEEEMLEVIEKRIHKASGLLRTLSK